MTTYTDSTNDDGSFFLFSFFLSWVAKPQLNHWTSGEDPIDHLRPTRKILNVFFGNSLPFLYYHVTSPSKVGRQKKQKILTYRKYSRMRIFGTCGIEDVF